MIFRHSLPTGLDEDEEKEFTSGLERLEEILSDIRKGNQEGSWDLLNNVELRISEEVWILQGLFRGQEGVFRLSHPH